MKKLFFIRITWSITFLLLMGCKTPNIKIANEEMLTQVIFADQTKSGLSFSFKGEWTSDIEPSEATSWLSLIPNCGNKSSTNISINLEPNTTGNERSAIISIICNGEQVDIKIIQKATVKYEEVYIAGDDGSTDYAGVAATLWKCTKSSFLDGKEYYSDEKQELAYGKYLIAVAYSVYVADNDVYVVGWEGNSEISIAKLWKNGKGTNLSDGKINATANSVFVSGSNVYVVGYEIVKNSSGKYNTFAKLWKNGKGINLSDGTTSAYASSVFVDGNDVYVAGYDRGGEVSEVSGYKFYNTRAKLWKNGIEYNLTDGSQYAEAYSVYISNGNCYVAGYESNGTNSIACVWINGKSLNLSDGANKAGARTVFVSNNDVYLAGYEECGQSYKPEYGDVRKKAVAVLWKNGVAQKLTADYDEAIAESMFVSGSDVYVAINKNNSRKEGMLWKNGTIVKSLYSRTATAANSIYVKQFLYSERYGVAKR